MIIDCISDLHGHYPKLDGGSLLIVAGDLTARDTDKQVDEFGEWLAKQKYDLKVFIGGNHDGFLQKNFAPIESLDIVYLCDSGITYKDFKIWGSPWTPTFHNWHFMKDRGEDIRAKWDLIPNNIDILVTHGPPYGILDKNIRGEHCGCEELREAAFRISPKLHMFGHIHEQGGKTLNTGITTYVNASIMNEKYQPLNKPIRIEL